MIPSALLEATLFFDTSNGTATNTPSVASGTSLLEQNSTARTTLCLYPEKVERIPTIFKRSNLWKGPGDHIGVGRPVLRGGRIVTYMSLHIVPQRPKRRGS